MVRFQRSARIAGGKGPEGIQWAKEVAEYINNKYQTQIGVHVELFGDVGTVYWITDYEDLAAVDRVNKQLQSDEGFQGMVKKAPDLFIEGSVKDVLMESV